MKRHLDWLRQAERDLAKAKRDLSEGDYEWACFTSQQAAAEKAVKALLQFRGVEVRGHTVGEMVEETNAPEELVDLAKELDHHYIPSRYPDAFASGTPSDHYTKKMAEEAVKSAERIVEYCRSRITGEIR
ncbi:MAG: HEPN domain-containing protein [Candidatus Freyarchaeum deiterrae]